MSIARKILDYKKELKSEAKGMGQEGRAYMRDKLKGKKYGGKLKDKYRDELAKEAFKLSPKGKKFLKKELDKPKDDSSKYSTHPSDGGNKQPKEDRLERAKKEWYKDVRNPKEDIKPKKYAGGGGAIHKPVPVTPQDRLKKSNYSGGGEAKNWIQGAVKKPGALRAVAKKEGLIKGDEVRISGSNRIEKGIITKINRTRAIIDVNGVSWTVPFEMIRKVSNE